MENKVVPNSFVAVSDFHAYDWPMDKVVNHYLNEYDKIYILGDATDRGYDGKGSGSVKLLNAIYSLSMEFPNRVVYIPGNHDQLLYDAVVSNDEKSVYDIKKRHGAQTYQDFQNFRKSDSEAFRKLFYWLGNLPIQREHFYKNQRYVFAHALFNQRLFDKKPSFSLNDLYQFKNKIQEHQYFSNILWFRKGGSSYYAEDLPNSDSIMVIGHTPERSRKGKSLDLVNKVGGNVRVHCVDGGISFDSTMLKYDGGEEVNFTRYGEHIDTSPSLDSPNSNSSLENLVTKEKIFRNVIVETMKNVSNKEVGYLLLQKFCLSGDSSFIPTKGGLQQKATILDYNSIVSIIQNYSYQRDGVTYNQNWSELYSDYINETVFDSIIGSLAERFGSQKAVVNHVSSFLRDGNLSYITQQVGQARTLARIVGRDSLERVIVKRHCNSVSAYVTQKFGYSHSK